MRLQTTITDLDAEQWENVQRLVRTKYEFTEGVTRVCLVIEHGTEERHAEMPLSSLFGLMAALSMVPALKSMDAALRSIRLNSKIGTPDTDQDDKNIQPEGADQ